MKSKLQNSIPFSYNIVAGAAKLGTTVQIKAGAIHPVDLSFNGTVIIKPAI